MCLLQKKKKKSHFSRAGGTSEICNAALSMHHRWQFCSVIFSKVPPGTSARLWRGCACDIAASRQNYATSPSKCHRCLLLVFFLSTLSAISIFCYLGEDYRSTFLSRCHSSLSAFVPWKQIYLLLSFLPCSALMEGLVTPLQDRIEEWKKTANQLDKDHAKG